MARKKGQNKKKTEKPPFAHLKQLHLRLCQRLLYVGTRPPAGGWPVGRYSAQYRVMRSGKAVVERRFDLQF